MAPTMSPCATLCSPPGCRHPPTRACPVASTLPTPATIKGPMELPLSPPLPLLFFLFLVSLCARARTRTHATCATVRLPNHNKILTPCHSFDIHCPRNAFFLACFIASLKVSLSIFCCLSLLSLEVPSSCVFPLTPPCSSDGSSFSTPLPPSLCCVSNKTTLFFSSTPPYPPPFVSRTVNLAVYSQWSPLVHELAQPTHIHTHQKGPAVSLPC